jgi:hypothetical protein
MSDQIQDYITDINSKELASKEHTLKSSFSFNGGDHKNYRWQQTKNWSSIKYLPRISKSLVHYIPHDSRSDIQTRFIPSLLVLSNKSENSIQNKPNWNSTRNPYQRGMNGRKVKQNKQELLARDKLSFSRECITDTGVLWGLAGPRLTDLCPCCAFAQSVYTASYQTIGRCKFSESWARPDGTTCVCLVRVISEHSQTDVMESVTSVRRPNFVRNGICSEDRGRTSGETADIVVY